MTPIPTTHAHVRACARTRAHTYTHAHAHVHIYTHPIVCTNGKANYIGMEKVNSVKQTFFEENVSTELPSLLCISSALLKQRGFTGNREGFHR